MLSIGAASKKRLATEGAGVGRPKKKAKPKRPIGTEFINFTCELDTDNCVERKWIVHCPQNIRRKFESRVLGQCR